MQRRSSLPSRASAGRDEAAFEQVTRFLEGIQAEICSRAEPWRGGVAYLHDEFKLVWDLNMLYVNDPPEGVSATELADEAEKLMGPLGYTHRRIWIPDETLGAALAPDFEELGWSTDVHVAMVHRHDPDRPADTSRVEEVGAAAWEGREKQLRSYPWCDDDDLVPQMRALYDLLLEAGNGRDLAIVEDGLAVSFALVFSRGEVAQIEDVATLSAYRGRGLSRAVVYKALQECVANHELTFLIADENDWPRDFYFKLGFEAVGLYYYFLKTLSPIT